MIHDHRAKLVDLLAEAEAALTDVPPDKASSLINTAAKLSAEIAAIDLAKSGDGLDGVAPGRGVTLNVDDNVTGLDRFRKAMGSRNARGA